MLGRTVLVTVVLLGHTDLHVSLLKHMHIVRVAILNAPVGMMRQRQGFVFPASQSHSQSFHRSFDGKAAAQRRAHNLTRIQVCYQKQINKAFQRTKIGSRSLTSA